MSSAKPHAGHYRPDIDGLRAIAILSVLAFHAFPSVLPGGFVGVDVFFVISGYLITGLLLDDLEGRELVSRRRSETDRRNNGLWLTPAGEAALARLRTVAEEHQADVLSPLDDAERAALAGLLQKLSDGSALPRDGHPGYGR